MSLEKMLRVMLCVSIVTAFPLKSAAAARISEDIPIPGGTAAVARAAGLPSAPDRSRFVAEMARVIYEVPEKQRQDPGSILGRVRTYVETAGRLRRALAGFGGDVSLTRASGESDRERLKRLLEDAGLRLRETRGRYSVEIDNERAARQRAIVLSYLGVDGGRLAPALNNGETVALRMPTELAPVPLTAELWSRVIFNTPVASADLFASIMQDERAALLCHGLAALDDATLEYLADRPALLRHLHLHARVFAGFGSHVKIRDGRVVTPASELGGHAVSVWESLVGAKTSAPDQFIAALFERNGGRLAYLYDTIAELDLPRAAFALGLAIADPQKRDARARVLLETTASAFAEWPTTERPFTRPLRDTAAVLMAVDVKADGTPRTPASRLLWSRAFEDDDVPEDPARLLQDADREPPIDAAWLAEHVAAADGQTRTVRVNQLAFGYRVFAAADAQAMPDVLVALRAMSKYRTAMLALEQMGVRHPAVYAAVARQAERVSRLDGGAAYLGLSQFQGALVLVGRLAWTRSIDPARTESLVSTLAAVPLGHDGRYRGGLMAWLRREILADRAGEGAEEALLAGLGGGWRQTVPTVIDWEGERYTVDLAVGEARRLRMIRTRQGGCSLDHVLELESIARRLAGRSTNLELVKGLSGALESLHQRLPPIAKRTESDVTPGGSSDVPEPRDTIENALRELGKIKKTNDLHRAGGIAEDLFMAVDALAAEVLASLAYAVNLGDSDGPALLGGDVARRHEFGIGSRVADLRVSLPWAIPEQHTDPGVPWHVSGSLMGLDVALAPLSLRRMSGDAIGGPPMLTSNDRDTFARSIALLNPYTLTDAQRDAIVEGIGRGRERVSMLKSGAGADAVADEIRMDGWRHRALVWTIGHQPDRKLSLFSLSELLILGGGTLEDLHGWGTAMTPLFGCLCTRMPTPNTWRFAIGRPQLGLLATAVSDLTLRVALALAELEVPAALAKAVLDAALPEYADTVRAIDGDDWLTLVRSAQTISRERIEDYVASAAVVGGPLVPISVNSSRER